MAVTGEYAKRFVLACMACILAVTVMILAVSAVGSRRFPGAAFSAAAETERQETLTAQGRQSILFQEYPYDLSGHYL